MEKLEFKNLYYSQDPDVIEYLQIYIETNKGTLKHHVTGFTISDFDSFSSLTRLKELDKMKDKHGVAYIEEVRKTYDNDMYLLISNKWILAIEYVLNSVALHSFQEIRLIENIYTDNKHQWDSFRDLEIVEMPIGR